MQNVLRREFGWSAAFGGAVGLASGLASAAMTGNALAALAVGAAGFVVATGLLGRRWLRRIVLLRTALSDDRRAVLEREVAFYRALDATQRLEFERNVQCFLAEHTITGPKGAAVGDDVKVLVAASAAMLLFGREDLDLPRYVDVVVYPDRFDLESYDVSKRADVAGVVHWQGPVIFSERDLRDGFARARDGQNVGLHEFAHLLDLESGHFDGMPSGMPWTAAKPWMSIVHAEMKRIRAHRSVMRDYGATNEPEFFAVATEAFFERPNEMRTKHAKLYDALKEFYGQDPATRPGAKT